MSESKKGRYIGAGIAFVILILFFMNMQGYFHHRIEPGKQPKQQIELNNLSLTEVKMETIEEFETVVGTVQSHKETRLAAKISAHVKKIYVSPGDLVKFNDLLILLDDRDLQAKLGQAQSNLQAAEAAFKQAKTTFDRYIDLIETGAATQSEYDNAEARYQMTSAKVQEAKKAIEELRIMIGYSRITAPYSGIIVEKYVNIGTLTNPGMPLLSLEDPEKLRLEVFVPESRREYIHKNQVLMIHIDALAKDIPGHVDEIVPSADRRSRSFLVRISLDPDENLRTGTFGRCYLPVRMEEKIFVDARAIYEVGQLTMAQVLTPENRLETRMVRVGSQMKGKLEILSGLEPGERVILKE